MKKMLLSLSLVATMAILLAACSTSTEPSDAYKGETSHEIYLHGRAALQNRDYGEGIKRFEALDVQYPFGADTQSAQFFIIYAYYMKEEYPLAYSAADRFIRLYPTYPYLDYAYYLRGLSDFYLNMGVMERTFSIDLAKRDSTQLQKSYNDFSELVERFPESRYAPSAHQYMVYLRNLMARHELQVAQYYYDHRAYVASAARASDVVAHYQGAPAVPSALALMVKSYHQLGETKLEQDSLSVLKYNYPNMAV